MLRATYSYDGPFPGCLKFSANDLFLKLERINEYWQLVARSDGIIGCVPENFVEEQALDDAWIVTCARKALDSLNNSENLNEIKDKDVLIKQLRTLVGVMPSESTPSTIPENRPRTQATPPNQIFSENISHRLVDAIRLGTNGSHAECFNSFRVLLEILGSDAPVLRQYTDALDNLLLLDSQQASFLASPDWCLLIKFFGLLEERVKNDQEYQWELHDDQQMLQRDLDRLTEVLIKANPVLVQHYLKRSDYQPLNVLIRLCQVEHRLLVRQRLLFAIGLCCSLEHSSLHLTLNSVLPLELIRYLCTSPKLQNITVSAMSLRLLTFLLARADQLPLDLKSRLDPDFFGQLLRFIGSQTGNPSIDELFSLIDLDLPSSNAGSYFEGKLSHAATILLLTCNWHFCSSETARKVHPTGDFSMIPLLEALLANPTAARSFFELIIHLFNRDLDPIFLVDFKPSSNLSHLNRLIKWADFLPTVKHSSVDSNYLMEHIFDLEDCDFTTHFFDDEGQYASILWSTSASYEHQAPQSSSLPQCMSPSTPRHSVVKLMHDVFRHSQSACLIDGSDQDVIIDIVNRQICNLQPQFERVQDFVMLLGLILANSDYQTRGAYKKDDLLHVLDSVIQSKMPTESNMSSNKVRSLIRSIDLAKATVSRLKLTQSCAA